MSDVPQDSTVEPGYFTQKMHGKFVRIIQTSNCPACAVKLSRWKVLGLKWKNKKIKNGQVIAYNLNIFSLLLFSTAKIVQNFDKKWGLWEEEEEKKDQEKEFQTFGLVSNNPVLKNITDYLVEEGNYEEEELLGSLI